MRRKAYKLRQFPLDSAKVNSTWIGSQLQSFVVGDSHNNVRLYTFEDNQQKQIYSSNSNNNVQTEVTAVALSCTQKEIFSGSNRGIINIWDKETAKAHTLLKGHSTSVNCFGIYPEDPSKLASGSYDTMIKLWDIREKNSTATLKGHSKPINSISISPDDYMLLSGSQDNTARLWELRFANKPIYTANEHNGPILKVKFNPQDCMFATCSMDRTAKYFRCQQKSFGFASSTEMVATPVTAICFSPDGRTLFTAANDVLKSWNMNKNGLLLQTFDAGWKGVQDIAYINGGLTAITFSGGSLNLWVCDAQKRVKNNSQMSEDTSFVLPKINRGGAGRFGDENDFNEMQNMIGIAIQKVNTIQDRHLKDNEKRAEQLQRKKIQFEKKRQQQQRKRQQLQKRKQQEQKRRAEIEKQKQLQRLRIQQQKEQKERKEQQKRRLEQQRMKEQLYNQRLRRQKQISEKVKQTLDNNQNLEATIYQDIQDNSSLMNISTFVVDSYQKEKLKQMELISDLMKDSNKFQKILIDRTTQLMPILNYWKQGRINLALQLAENANHAIKIDFTATILTTPRFKSGITLDVAIFFTRILCEVMKTQKHATYVYLAMKNLNLIVLMFKQQLIKIKSFNPLTRVDLSRQERLAKYDKLLEEFLTLFRQERLKKYSQAYKNRGNSQSDEKSQIAFELYKNLQQILIKILPKQEPQLA